MSKAMWRRSGLASVVLAGAICLTGCVGLGNEGEGGVQAQSQRVQQAVSEALNGMETQVSMPLSGTARDLVVSLYPGDETIGADGVAAALRAIAGAMPRDVASVELGAWDLEAGPINIEDAAIAAGIRRGDIRDGITVTIVDTNWLMQAFSP